MTELPHRDPQRGYPTEMSPEQAKLLAMYLEHGSVSHRTEAFEALVIWLVNQVAQDQIDAAEAEENADAAYADSLGP